MTLAEKIGSTGLPESEAKPLFGAIADTIAFCHRYSIIHRDVKLENVLLDCSHPTAPTVKLIDFGLANFFDRKGLMATFCGSLPYTAPEILRGDAYVGPEVDVWSLGVLLYVVITANFPFEDPSQPRNYEKIMSGDFHLKPEMSIELRNLLRRMLEPTISKRLTMDQVLSHPWLANYRRKANPSSSSSLYDVPVAARPRTPPSSALYTAGPEANRDNGAASPTGDNSVPELGRTAMALAQPPQPPPPLHPRPSSSTARSSSLADASAVPIRLPIDPIAAWEVAVCLDISLQNVLQKLPSTGSAASSSADIRTFSSRTYVSSNPSYLNSNTFTCGGDVSGGDGSSNYTSCSYGNTAGEIVMVPNSPIVSVYTL
ncbi:Serine/threonine-protein kinase, partial [Spiromyces aspiralis]